MGDGLQIEVLGADTLASTLDAAARDLADYTDQNRRAGEVAARTAAGRAPRRTGRLAGSVRVLSADRAGAEVGTTVAYGRFQDLGTRFVRPTYYLSGTLGQAEGAITAVYETAVDQTLGKVRGQ
jgi:hypothetical protein